MTSFSFSSSFSFALLLSLVTNDNSGNGLWNGCTGRRALFGLLSSELDTSLSCCFFSSFALGATFVSLFGLVGGAGFTSASSDVSFALVSCDLDVAELVTEDSVRLED
uniref:Secreted protein n=1 Tax=Cacopsylla melanoneura TaxID=428564 RepID=A0A8D8ZQK7_9HEMI